MIIFEGKLSGQALKKCNMKLQKEIILTFSIIGVIIILIWFLIFGLDETILTPVIAWVCIFAISLIVYKKINVKSFKITIDSDEGTVIYQDKNDELFSMIKDIDTVYDYGDYYHIFEAGDMFLCQKKLLVQGSIEEFEKIFDGKIICKH